MIWFVLIGTFFFMEGVAWFTHKYLMHGVLWILHRDHHTHENKGSIEKNDSFFLIFATPGILCTLLGSFFDNDISFGIGIGITLYGLCYFLVHDVFIHQRIKWFRRSNNRYFKGIRKAHKMHHKHRGKEDGECFGMLWVPFKYLRKVKLK